jgi:hypothetical protein
MAAIHGQNPLLMSAFFPAGPPPDDDVELSPELRDYLVACVRSARPSPSRDDALRLLGEVDVEDLWELPNEPVDWDEIEAEARRQGCTVADVLYDRAGRDPR